MSLQYEQAEDVYRARQDQLEKKLRREFEVRARRRPDHTWLA